MTNLATQRDRVTARASSTMRRAYSRFEVKAATEENGKRLLEGIATTPTPDRMGDIVDPMGAQFDLPLPLLWQHDSDQPIGWVMSAKPTPSGITVSAEIATLPDPGNLKDRLDEAWQSLKMGLVRGFSIGFAPIEYTIIEDTYAYRFVKWEWLELSAVTIPANAEATISQLKRFDAKHLPKFKRGVSLLTPAVAKQLNRRAAVKLLQG